MKKILTVSVSTLAVFMAVGCGSSNGSQTGQAYYIDAAVSGVEYVCGNQSGTTGADGSFVFEVGEGCVFSLGDMPLRSVDTTLLSDGQNVYEQDITIAQILQSMDADGDASNGISIPANTVEALANEGITSLPSTQAELDVMLEVIASNGGREVGKAEAQQHLDDTREKAEAEAINNQGPDGETLDGDRPTEGPNGETPDGDRPTEGPNGETPDGDRPTEGPNGETPDGDRPTEGPNGETPDEDRPTEGPNGETPDNTLMNL
ncbi:MAG: hypothetical protein Q9M36_04140 [Sulfurovum sp.]|nr:hypothetical protein [Sulfurovum sp.]